MKKRKDSLRVDPRVHRLVKRAKAITTHLNEVRPLYNELDQITIALVKARVPLARYGAVIVDNYADKNTAFRATFFKRYEIKWR